MVLRFDDDVRHDLFFAVRPDDVAKAQLAQITDRLRCDRNMLRGQVEPERWHVTLDLLGQFRDQIPSRLVPDALAVASTLKAPPFDVTFDYVLGAKSGLLLKLSEGSPALNELRAFRRSLVEALIRAGLRRPAKPKFDPHLTLSYGSSCAPRMSIQPVSWTVRDFVLIESLVGKHQHIERGRWSI